MTKTEQVQAECKRRGLKVSPFGQGWHITGPNVDLLSAKLSLLTETDLKPLTNFYQPGKGKT